jgi:Fe2+ transport system protein B
MCNNIYKKGGEKLMEVFGFVVFWGIAFVLLMIPFYWWGQAAYGNEEGYRERQKRINNTPNSKLSDDEIIIKTYGGSGCAVMLLLFFVFAIFLALL